MIAGSVKVNCRHCNKLIEGEYIGCPVCWYAAHVDCPHPDIELVLRRAGQEVVVIKELDRHNLWSETRRIYIMGMIQQAIAEARWQKKGGE